MTSKPKKPKKRRSKPKLDASGTPSPMTPDPDASVTPDPDAPAAAPEAIAAVSSVVATPATPAPVSETEPVSMPIPVATPVEEPAKMAAPSAPIPLATTQPVETAAIVEAAPVTITQPVETGAIVDSKSAPVSGVYIDESKSIEVLVDKSKPVVAVDTDISKAFAAIVESKSEAVAAIVNSKYVDESKSIEVVVDQSRPVPKEVVPMVTAKGVVLPPREPSIPSIPVPDPSAPIAPAPPSGTERGVVSPELTRAPAEASNPAVALDAQASNAGGSSPRSSSNAAPIAKPADASKPQSSSDAAAKPVDASKPQSSSDAAARPADADRISPIPPSSPSSGTGVARDSIPAVADASKPALSVVPSLLEVPSLSKPTSSLLGDKAAEPSTAVRVDLREGPRRTGDDRRKPDDKDAGDKGSATAKPGSQTDATDAKPDTPSLTDSATAKPGSQTDATDAKPDTPSLTDSATAKPGSQTDATDAKFDKTDDKASGKSDDKASGKSDDKASAKTDDKTADAFTERRSGEDRRAVAAGATATAVGEPSPYLMDPEAATLPAPEPTTTAAPTVAPLDPGAAALEAARIAGEIVGDIATASGAAIVAAAAAGAAIEAARAQQAAGIGNVAPQAAGAAAAAAVASATTAATTTAPPATDGSSGDPVTTVRMQRERILRALAEDIAASPVLTESQAAPKTEVQARGASQGEARAPSHEGETHADDEQLDPVQIAAAAIQRLRVRATTNVAELRGHYHRHDVVVLLAALLIIIVVGRIHADMVTPPNVVFPEHEKDEEAIARGLTFEHSQSWLKAERLAPWPPRIMRDPSGTPPKPSGAYHAALTHSLDPTSRIEVFIDKRPAWTNIVTGLELDRRTRWGELYTLDQSSVEEIGDQNWLRTAYRYAHAAEKGDVPRVDRAIEYATVDREQIYVVTLFGSDKALERIEEVVAPTLRTPQKQGARSALPLVPQTRAPSHRNYPDAVSRAFDSTVMIVVADLIDGRLVARGGGSGVIVGADGSILTNYHVIHDKNGRLHDVFVIGRYSQLDKAPQLQCAGRPNRSKLQRELDLALVKCDTDLDGRVWTPATTGVWPTLQEAKAADVKIGNRLWVLGFPDVGGGGLTMSTGEIGGWTGQDGAAGRDFIKTDASITHGNSGGPVVDDRGRLVGVASASRTKISATGGVIETKQVGLVRPIATAADLLTIATIGWTPREGHTDVEIQPSAVEAPAEGIRIATHVIDHANEAPIRDALVMVLRAGVSASEIDINRLDDQVIAWGRSNTQGEVQLKQPVPIGSYTVLVRASGYEPLIGEHRLKLDEKSPPAFDPWGGIRMLAR